MQLPKAIVFLLQFCNFLPLGNYFVVETRVRVYVESPFLVFSVAFSSRVRVRYLRKFAPFLGRAWWRRKPGGLDSLPDLLTLCKDS